MNKLIGSSVIHPRKKITVRPPPSSRTSLPCFSHHPFSQVMIIGNHSAGKSSFINWYIEDDVQSTGVSVETMGFTVVTSGSIPNEFKGDAAMRMVPHLKSAVDKLGADGAKAFTDNLSVVVSTSKAKMSSLIDMIDTPGLVDGNTE